MLIFSSFLIINNVKDNSVKAITGNGTLGHTTAWTTAYNVSYGKNLMIRERECSEVVNCPYNARVNCIWAYLRYSYAPQTVTCGFYDNLGTYVYKTEEKNISSSSFKWYQFNFTRLVPTISSSNYMIVVYGNCPTSPGLTTRIYIQIGGTDSGTQRYMHEENNYPTFDNAPSWTSQPGKDFSLYCEYDIYPHNSTDITVYSNPVNCSGTTQTQYDSATGWKVWSNYTSRLLKYENIGYASGTHESRWDTATSRFIVWANYSSRIKKYENIKNATGTHDSRWDTPAGSWIVWANYTGYSILLNLLENLHNCTGTHASYYNNITGWKIYNNYTGYSLILTILENLKNCTGAEQYYYNNITGWKVYNNFTGFSILLNAIENLINCTGTHASYYNSATGWKMYLNYTGNGSGGGSPVNRTINITINGHGFFNSWNGSINTNVQNVSILMNSDKSIIGNFSDNDSFYEDKYFLEGVLSIESGLLFLGICLSLWIFFISKYLEYKDMTIAYIQFGLSIPTCIIVGAFSFSYAFGFVVVFLIPILSLSLIADGYFYRKKLKKK
jgi:hypothetical protein